MSDFFIIISMLVTNIIAFIKRHFAFLVGLAFVLIVAPITFHGDFYILSLYAKKIASGNLNIYSDMVLSNGYKVGKPIMPPVIFFADGLNYFIFQSLGFLGFNYDSSMIGQIPSSLQIFLLKSRYILLFMLSYPLIKKVSLLYSKDPKDSAIISNLWILSPILLFLPFTQSNNDIYPTLMSLVFLFFAFRKNYTLAMITLGLSAGMKSYAVFLIPIMAIIFGERKLASVIKYGLISAVTLILIYLPYINDLLLFGKGGSEGFLILQTVIPPSYYLFPILYILLISYLFFSNRVEINDDNKNPLIIKYGFLAMSLFYVMSTFIPQWFLWILPFFVFVIYKDRRLFAIYALLVMVYLLSFVANWSNNLDLKLFLPLFPNFKGSVFPGVVNLKVIFMVGTVFSALYISFLYFYLFENRVTKKLKLNETFYSLIPLGIYLSLMAIFAYILFK